MKTLCTFIYVCLLLSDPQLLEGRRIKSKSKLRLKARKAAAISQGAVHELELGTAQLTAKSLASSKQNSTVDLDAEASWCNPFSRLHPEYLKMEVLESGENCEVGVCTAYEFIRHKKNPRLEVHHGQSWAIMHAAGKILNDIHGEGYVWNLVVNSQDESLAWDKTYNIFDALSITFGDENEDRGLREYVLFRWADGTETKVEGGIFLKDKLVKDGLDRVHYYDDEDHKHGDDALEAHHSHHMGIVSQSASLGGEIAAASAGLAMTGFFVAASAQGIAVSNSALVTAGLAATIGGGALGALLGAGIGASIGMAGAVSLIKWLRKEGLSAADQMWEKLWCLDFDVCERKVWKNYQYTTTIVTSGRECPGH